MRIYKVSSKVLFTKNIFSTESYAMLTGNQGKTGNLHVLEVQKELFTPPDGDGYQKKYCQKFPRVKLLHCLYKNRSPISLTVWFSEYFQ